MRFLQACFEMLTAGKTAGALQAGDDGVEGALRKRQKVR